MRYDDCMDQPKPGRRRVQADHPAISDVLRRLGANLRVARVARDVSLVDAASRANVSVQTLRALENGAPGVKIEAVARMLWQMNMVEHLGALADPQTDEEGQRLAALRAPTRARGARIQTPTHKATWADIGIDRL